PATRGCPRPTCRAPSTEKSTGPRSSGSGKRRGTATDEHDTPHALGRADPAADPAVGRRTAGGARSPARGQLPGTRRTLHARPPDGRTRQGALRRRIRPGAAVRKRLRRDRRSEEHTSELQSRENLVCRLLLEKKK